MRKLDPDAVTTLDTSQPVWERFFLISPMVIVGTLEEDGTPDFAPKHMAMPVSWENYFGFVCTPRHRTYANIQRDGQFTVTYPRPSQLLYASLAATPRADEDTKPVLGAFDTVAAEMVKGQFVADGYVFLECQLHKIIDGFGDNSLITGKLVATHVHRDALRITEQDEQDMIHRAPLLAYVHPWRFASVSKTSVFPVPEGMRR